MSDATTAVRPAEEYHSILSDIEDGLARLQAEVADLVQSSRADQATVDTVHLLAIHEAISVVHSVAANAIGQPQGTPVPDGSLTEQPLDTDPPLPSNTVETSGDQLPADEPTIVGAGVELPPAADTKPTK